MALYDDLKSSISEGFYTLLEAKGLLNGYFMQLQINEDQYNELMDMAKKLNPNDSDDEAEIRLTKIEKSIEAVAKRIDAIEKSMASGGTIVPEPSGQTGTADDPITAYRGMTYEKGKYYEDPEKGNEIYLCTYNESVSTEPTVTINGLPHEYVNIYFNWYSMPAA